MSSRPLLLIDFDRTLFNTAQFIEQWWQWLSVTYGLDSTQELARIEEFFSYVGEWRNYDFYAHVMSLGLPDDIAVVLHDGHEALRHDMFLYDDWRTIHQLHEARPLEIVTFGNERYQRYKLSLCPQLQDWTTHIIQEEKGDFIARQFGDRPVVLVDDKMLAGTMPVTAEFIHLDRSQTEPYLEHETYRSINTLAELEKLV